MHKDLLLTVCAVLWCLSPAAAPTIAESRPAPSGIVTLASAIQRALEASPTLQAAAAAADASKGAQRQAGVLPNPELGIEAENIGGEGGYRGFDAAETTLAISQLVEIGGKRAARQDAADHEHAIAHAELEATRLDLIRDVKIAFAEAVAAKEGVALAAKQKSLAAEVLANVTKRVNAAAEPLFQRSKSEVALATSEVALDKARREYLVARKRLAALWDSAATDFEPDSSYFFDLAPPSAATPPPAGAANPSLLRWQSEIARSEAIYALERANALPDPRFSAGVKDFRATDQRALVVGVSIPLPLFNQNSGNIARARSEVTKAASQKRAAEITAASELTRTREERENAYREAQTLRTRIIPSAEKSYALSRQGYGAGKFPYLEVLDAQRTLVEARVQYNEALRTYHSRAAEVERLTSFTVPEPDQKDDAHAD